MKNNKSYILNINENLDQFVKRLKKSNLKVRFGIILKIIDDKIWSNFYNIQMIDVIKLKECLEFFRFELKCIKNTNKLHMKNQEIIEDAIILYRSNYKNKKNYEI